MKTRTKVIGWLIGAVVLIAFFGIVFLNYLSMKAFAPVFKVHRGEDRVSAIGRILENVEFGNIAFKAPRSMNLGDTSEIQLMLRLATPTDELKRMIEAEGGKVGTRIRVSDRMEARLSGPNFAITAITPEIQAVSRDEVTEWKWQVKPSREGRQYLYITLSALLNVHGASTRRAIRTFDTMVEVEVSWRQPIGSFVEENWQWLWAALLLPIVGWLFRKKKGSKPNPSQFDS